MKHELVQLTGKLDWAAAGRTHDREEGAFLDVDRHVVVRIFTWRRGRAARSTAALMRQPSIGSPGARSRSTS
jgi:hypothetical protein